MGIFIFGTLWFWLLITIASGFIIFILESALDNDRDRDDGGGFRVTLVIIGSLILYYFLGSKEDIISIFAYIKDNPGFVLSLFGGYLTAGVVWSIVKWYFYLMNKKHYLRERYLQENNYSSSLIRDAVPKAKYNKSKIMSWMMYWPFSGLWTLINEPIKKAFQVIYRNIEGFFDKMSNKIFADELREADEKAISEEKEREKAREDRANQPSKRKLLND